ncbi:MAG: hypothetical protein DWH82_09830 [Planctomycetota bacterium]|nr:MAG: hypothetical protein DWH82_09830 [Planctomycetota bacterium]
MFRPQFPKRIFASTPINLCGLATLGECLHGIPAQEPSSGIWVNRQGTIHTPQNTHFSEASCRRRRKGHTTGKFIPFDPLTALFQSLP